jgi:hypothetical protein
LSFEKSFQYQARSILEFEISGGPVVLFRNKTVALLFISIVALTGCDFYEYKINEDYSICAVDSSDKMRLCRNLGNDSFQEKLEPAIAAVGHNGSNISMRQCFEGVEGFYSVDAHQTSGYNDPVYIGPIDRDAWAEETEVNPEQWPPFVRTFSAVERKHCPEAE